MKWILPYQGRDWEFDDSRLTAAEARLQKRVTGGSTPSAAGAARFELDPDALVAALIIARRRTGLPIEEAASIDDEALDLSAVGEATEKAAKAAHKPAPAVVEGETVDPVDSVGEEIVRVAPAKRTRAKSSD